LIYSIENYKQGAKRFFGDFSWQSILFNECRFFYLILGKDKIASVSSSFLIPL